MAPSYLETHLTDLLTREGMSRAQALAWLSRPSDALGGESPLRLAQRDPARVERAAREHARALRARARTSTPVA